MHFILQDFIFHDKTISSATDNGKVSKPFSEGLFYKTIYKIKEFRTTTYA